ncbi:hypothetical protein [Salsipaludibacter albus]|uniref:hypothetical protein n=1 Tax=Salsipaludibacter albus TaxID=2849650 RepID=UPI001EE3CBA1|nr:hypothetical protein [Salsipaludibacter albus]MBY5162173.1 hypothetical protein [Salsipaludibacter albus]
MPRRNRVDPLGRIVGLPQRGAFTGNRGVLTDDHGTIVREQAARAWITCALEFGDRRRELAQPGRWTELFFWDEATALAAGHRPCFTCRRVDAVAFRDAFRRVTGRPDAGAPDVDRVLADERRVPRPRWGSGRRLVMVDPARLPSGAVVLHHDVAHLLAGRELHRWTARGWGVTVPVPTHELALVTPPTTTRILSDGYEPLLRVGEVSGA